MSGPLSGIRVVELAGLGPAPYAAMLLADLGAEVLRVDRAQGGVEHQFSWLEIVGRSRRSVALDLKHPDGLAALLRLVDRADVLLEGFRPGVTERLGLGPDVCRARNPRLVYGRMTGWGQDGPLAHTAGHDIDYIALAGALAHIGPAGGKPVPPLNLVGDFGGGGVFLAFGVVCALVERATSGEGQVVDAAMVDGVASLMAFHWALRSMGMFDETRRGANTLDGGAPYYDTYETADGKYVAVGPVEPQFYSELLERLGLAEEPLPAQEDVDGWPVLRARFTEVFRSRTRAEWIAVFDGANACVVPVLTMTEAAEHPHMQSRSTIVEHDGRLQPAPAPRFSRTPGAITSPAPHPGDDTLEGLVDWGFTKAEVEHLLEIGAAR